MFFQILLSGRKRHLIGVEYIERYSGDAVYIHFCDVCSCSFSLLLLKIFSQSFKCLINANQQSKDETLICAI